MKVIIVVNKAQNISLSSGLKKLKTNVIKLFILV